jgi:CBS domain-containing protein
VAEAVALLLTDSQEPVLLVVSADGEPVGALGITNLRGTRRAMWDVLTAGDVMTPLANLPRLPADLPIAEALVQLDEWPGAAIVEEAGRVVGVVTRTRLLAWSAPAATRDRGPSSA